MALLLQFSCINSQLHLGSSNFSLNYEIQDAAVTGKLVYLRTQICPFAWFEKGGRLQYQ